MEEEKKTPSRQHSLGEIKKIAAEILPKECGLVDVELEGPDVVIYLQNVGAFFEDETIIKKFTALLS